MTRQKKTENESVEKAPEGDPADLELHAQMSAERDADVYVESQD